MFCEKCGSPLEEGANFCTQCGAPVVQEETKEPEKPETAEAPEASEEAKESEKPETAEAPEASEEAKEPEKAEAPEASEEAKEPEKAETAEAPEASEEAKEPEKPETAEAPEASEEAKESEKPETAEAPEAPEEAKEPEKAEEPEASEEAKEPEKAGVPEVPKTPKGAWTSEPPVIPAIPVVQPANEGSSVPKKKKKALPFIIGGVVLLAVVAVCVANAANLKNFFIKTFSSPKEYYQYVEQNTVSQIAKQSSAYYERMVLDSLNMDNRSGSSEITVELGEAGQDLLDTLGMAGMDLSWLKQLSLGTEFSMKDDVIENNISIGLNQTGILSVNMLMDNGKRNLYLQIPELTAKYIGVYLGNYDVEMLGGYQERYEALKALQKVLPAAKDVEKLLNKYLSLAVKNVTDVEKSTETLKVEGVRQKCTVLEVTLDGDNLADIFEAVLEEMQDDKDIKKLIVDMADALLEMQDSYYYGDMDGKDVYDEFLEELEEALDDLDDVRDSDGKLVMTIYVNGKSEIIGREIEVREDRETYLTIRSLMSENGDKFGYEFSMEPEYGDRISMIGSGKKSGDKISGEFELEARGMHILDVSVSKLDIEQMKQGYLNGSLTISLSRQAGTLLSAYLPYGSIYTSMLSNIQLSLDSQMSKDSGKMTLGILYEGEKLGSVSVSAKTGDGSKVKVPDASQTVFIEDDDDFADWLDGIEWDKLLKSLEKANLPDDIMEEIEDILDLMSYYGIENMLESLYYYY